MPKSTELTAIAFSPWTSNAIINFCQSPEAREKSWYWANVKSGMDKIIFFRRVVFASAFLCSISQVAPMDDYRILAVTIVSGAVMAFSLGSLYIQAKKIHTIVEPYLKVSVMGAEPILVKRPSVEESKISVVVDYGATNDPLKGAAKP